MPASCSARTFLLSRQTKLLVPFTPGTVRIMVEVDSSVNVRFEGDLQQALEESLSSFPVTQLKAEQRFIIEKIVGRRDVFGQLPTGYGKSLTFQLLPGVLKSLNAKGYDFPSTPLVVVISPLMSIVEDQVKYLRSTGIQAAYIRESKTKDAEILNRSLKRERFLCCLSRSYSKLSPRTLYRPH